MAQTITKTDVLFNDYTVTREVVDGVTHYFVNVGYIVPTDDGDQLIRSRRRELTGANATTAANQFAAITTALKNLEGIP